MVVSGFLPDVTSVYLLVIGVATVAIWIGSGWLEESAEQLSVYYGVPPVIQGSVVVAMGSSFPEFATVVLAGLAGVFDMGIGTIVGSAIFNILAIPALSGLVVDGDLESNRSLVYKEAQFYMIAVSGLVVTFALAVIYAPQPGGDLLGEITPTMALVPLLLYGMYLFIQWQDMGDYEPTGDPINIALGREWGKLLASLLVIFITIDFLVTSVESLALTFGMPEFLAGVLIVSAATSLPDTIVSVRAAREARGLTSLGNVLGSNTFNLLVAIPIGVLLIGGAPVNFAVAAPMMGVLTVATMLLFALLRTDLQLTTAESIILMLAYLIFVGWIITETIGVTDLIVGI